MPYEIEVVVGENLGNTEKGKLLEDLGYRILQSMQYEVIKEIRITGMEVDLLAKNKVNGEEIYIECKAHKATLSADVLTKIIGNVTFKGVSSGWLITTGPLSKDAKGIMNEWEKKELQKRKLLSIYTKERIIRLLQTTGNIVSDKSLKLDKNKTYREGAILLISNYGEYWLKIENIFGSTIAQNIFCFNSKTGEQIKDNNLLRKLKELDTEYKNLNWNSFDMADQFEVKDEIDSVVEVSSGDEWADYRPSRPNDFVGREDILEATIKYFNKSKVGLSDTRLFSITAPSGWGKSSYLLRLSSEIFKKNKKDYFIYSVDLRAAISSRYAEFAIMDCFDKAIKDGFIKKPIVDLTYSNSSVPFQDESFQEVFKQLEDEKKIIIICFDQFEETFSKKELMNLFESIKKISINVDSIKENIILGFAWKTDVIIPAEHPAYHMWHSLTDRRKNFELTVLSRREMKEAIKIFSKQIKEPINKMLQEYIIDQCQGYPWLLKKFCIHIYKLVASGINQDQIIGQNMNIEDLFQKDLSELSHSEDACIRKIATDTPADYYKIHDIYGENVIQDLINKRLVLRKGQKLILYWDIFRDYVIDGKIPRILFNYVPQLNFNKYIQILEYFDEFNETTVEEFSDSLNISEKTSLNIIKDLIMYGNIEKNKSNIKFKQKSSKEAINRVLNFWENHIVLNLIENYTESISKVDVELLRKDFNNINAFSHINIKTKNAYFNRILQWLMGLNIIQIDELMITLVSERSQETFKNIKSLRINRTRRDSEFMGQGTYKKVLQLVDIIKNENMNELNLKKYRNEISTLKALKLININDKNIVINIGYNEFEKILNDKVKATKAIKVVYSYDKDNKEKLTNEIVGSILKEEFKKNEWKETTEIRNGGSILRWYKKVYKITK